MLTSTRLNPGRASLPTVILLALALGCIALSHSLVEGRAAPHKLTILFTGDDYGSVKGGCGCGAQPILGGVPVRATYAQKMREEEGDILLVDAGDALPGAGALAEIKAHVYTKSFPHMAYDAVAIGDMEVVYISDTGDPRPFGEDVPPLCANVVDASTGRPYAEAPYIVKMTESGLRVGIIAVLGNELVDPGLQKESGLRILPPAEVLRERVPELREKCDLVVLLSHNRYDVSKRLAEDIRGLDVVISGHSSTTRQEGAKRFGGTVLMQTKTHGKYIGKLVLEIDGGGKVKSFEGEHVGLGKSQPGDPEMVKVIDTHNEELLAFYERMRAKNAPGNVSGVYQARGPQPYVSAAKCRECHPKEYASWTACDHSRAFDSLKKQHSSADPECLGCHTLGFTVQGGFTSEAATPQFKAVQCEECHGPGIRHVRRPGKGYGAVLQSTCTQCHTPERSPKFDREEFARRIMHSKPGTTTARAPASGN